jgi:hypothetical protein
MSWKLALDAGYCAVLMAAVYGAQPRVDTFEGQVVGASPARVVLHVERDRVTFLPADDVSVMLDGRPSRLEHLRLHDMAVIRAEHTRGRWQACSVEAHSGAVGNQRGSLLEDASSAVAFLD